MTNLILRSLEELGDYFTVATDATDTTVGEEGNTDTTLDDALRGPEKEPAMPDLTTLLERLTRAGATLDALTRQDAEARRAGAGLLNRYDDLNGEVQRAQAARAQAQQVHALAEALVTGAFSAESRAAATEVLALAAEAQQAATHLAETRRADLEALAAEPALARLLEERRMEEQRRQVEAAEAAAGQRLREGLAAVERAMTAGRLEEAQALLGELAKDHPDSADVASVQSIVRQRVQSVKSLVAEEALRLARRAYRQAPDEAISRLEVLDFTGLPEHLLHQITGVWAAACARLCRQRGALEPRLRYLPEPGLGVVVAREAEGQPYTVVSALGAPFQPGAPVDDRFVQRTRPLRASGR